MLNLPLLYPYPNIHPDVPQIGKKSHWLDAGKFCTFQMYAYPCYHLVFCLSAVEERSEWKRFSGIAWNICWTSAGMSMSDRTCITSSIIRYQLSLHILQSLTDDAMLSAPLWRDLFFIHQFQIAVHLQPNRPHNRSWRMALLIWFWIKTQTSCKTLVIVSSVCVCVCSYLSKTNFMPMLHIFNEH